MVKFNVLKEKIESEPSGFRIPIQITFEGSEQGLGVGYLESELISALVGGRHSKRTISGEGSDEIFVGFKKEEIHELPSIIKSIKESLGLIIKKYADNNEKRQKQGRDVRERKEKDLEEIKEELKKIDFG